jgi:hypothetical protein
MKIKDCGGRYKEINDVFHPMVSVLFFFVFLYEIGGSCYARITNELLPRTMGGLQLVRWFPIG